MYIKGYASNKPHVKSAKISGGVIGTWHPHSSTSVYECFARMSQPWVNNIPEVDWHGSNGSQVGGPECASERYTEARLSKASEDSFFFNIKKNTVNMILNFSEDEEWPEVFPAIMPRLMVNGSQGVGVTLTNTWLPNNLIEITQKIKEYITTGTVDCKNIYPDFPSGGVIINKKDLESIYTTGKGKVVLRAKAEIKNDSILITELPYQVYVEPLIDEIKELINKEEITGIRDIYNKSDKKRLLIEIECDKSPAAILAILFAKTDLQKSYNPNQYALVGKTPKLLNLLEYIKIYVDHNLSCLRREKEFDLDKAQKRKEIVDGLLRALEDLDNIIAIIKDSKDTKDAKENLINLYNFTENQVEAIVSLKLGRLAKLEQVELNEERAALVKEIEELQMFLSDAGKQKEELLSRLEQFTSRYGHPRRTEVVQMAEPNKEEQETVYVEPEKCVVILTKGGNIKRIAADSFKVASRNTKGIKKQEDVTTCIIKTNTIDTLLVFTNKGTVYRLLVDNIPVGNSSAKGTSIKNLIKMEPMEEPVLIYSFNKESDSKYILFVTKNGTIKKTALSEYASFKKNGGLIATKLRDGDSLAAISLLKEEDIMIFTKKGVCIRFSSSEIVSTGRNTIGIRGITLGEGDEVLTALVVRDTDDDLAVFSKTGNGLRSKLSEFLVQGKGGKGIICHKEGLVAVALVNDSDTLLVSGDKNNLCISAKEIPVYARARTGVCILKDNIIQSVSKI